MIVVFFCMPRQQLSCTAHGLSSWSCTGNPMCPGTGSIIIKILISWGDEIKDWNRRSVGLVLKIQFAQDSMPGAERERPEIVSPNAWTVRKMIDSLNRNCETISRDILLCFNNNKRHSYTKKSWISNEIMRKWWYYDVQNVSLKLETPIRSLKIANPKP